MRFRIILYLSCLLASSVGLALTTEAINPSKATIADSAKDVTGSYAALYFLEAVDDVTISPTIATTLRQGTRYFLGPSVLVVGKSERLVTSGKVRLKLRARYGYLAPVESLRASRNFVAGGVIQVDLEPGKRYRVNGILDPYRREVWLEEDDTGNLVGNKIVTPPDDESLQAMRGAAFTCCNLRYSDDWISDNNALGNRIIPAGARIVVEDYGRNRAQVRIDGRLMRIGHDYGRKEESREDFVAKWISKDDPKIKLARWPVEIRNAVLAGNVVRGMTKEQAIMSLGFPRTDRTKSISEAKWTYFTVNDEEYVISWDANGLLSDVSSANLSISKQVLAGEKQ